MEEKEMIYWIPLILLIVVAFLMMKYKEIRHRLGWFALIVVLLFVIITYGSLYSTHKPDLTTFDGNMAMVKIYFSWLGGIFQNVGKIGGYAVKQEWGLNTSNITNATLK